jgi:hypothetical protein
VSLDPAERLVVVREHVKLAESALAEQNWLTLIEEIRFVRGMTHQVEAAAEWMRGQKP